MKKILLDPKENLIVSLISAVLFMTVLTNVFGIDGIGRFIGGAAVIGIIKLITKRLKGKIEAGEGGPTEGTDDHDQSP